MRGRYRYLLNDAQVDVEETFSHERASWQSRRIAGGVRLEVEATVDGAGVFDEVLVEWVGAGLQRSLTVSRRADGWCWALAGPTGSEELIVASSAYFFPLLRCFQGQVVTTIEEAGPEGLHVVVPDIRDPSDGDQLLRPLVDRRAVTRRPDGIYEYLGGSYDAAARCTIGADGLLDRYTWEQPGVGNWDVQCERLT